MILECIVTTINVDGSVNIAPMGPFVNDDLSKIELRPFQSTTTFTNLKRTGQAVLHVTDDVRLIALTAIGAMTEVPPMVAATKVDGRIIADTCRFYELETTFIDESSERSSIQCRVVSSGRLRDFFGFNRAKHAVIEAAVVATRIGFVPMEEITGQMDISNTVVTKTGGEDEIEAMAKLTEFVRSYVPENRPSADGEVKIESPIEGVESRTMQS